MNANLNNIPLFQFPPSIESELEARGYTSSTHAAAVPMQQPHHPSYQHYDDTGTFLARRSSTSMIPQVARSQQPSHQFSNVPVRHYSSPLSAADVHGRQNATFRHPNDLQARPPIASSPFGASHPNRAGTFGTSTFAPPQPQLSVMQQTTEHAREQQQRAMMYTSPPPMISPEGIYQDHGMVKQEEPTTGICSDASSSASHMTAYSACQYPAKTAPSDERATQFDVYVQDGYEGTMPSSHVQGNLTYDSSSTPLPSDQHGEVKREEVMDDMSMSWGDEPLYASPAGAGPSSGVMPDHEQPSIHPPQTYEFEQKSFEASQSQDVWDYTQHQQLYIDTTPVTPQDYNMLPYGAVDAYGYIDSPMSVSHPDHHFGLRHSSSPRPSLHPIAPPPSSQNRSYTLEGAITPISPPSLPPPQPHPQPDPQNTNARSSSPPMGSLRPPSRPTSGSSVKVERSSSAIPPATGSSASASATPVISPEAPVPATAPLTKRPRGRPRKNPPSARPSSPPPHVDYPFPQFPDNPSSTSSSASPAYAGAGKGKAPEAGGVVPPIAGPVPVITAGTPGASGPMAGSSSCSQPRSHSHSDAAAAANVDGNATGKASSSSNVPPGLTAGQGIFRLNMPREGEETAAEPTGEKKKPIMACLFCRERKIACGPPPPGGPKRCNQCTRRDLVCEYPKESRRGQHKRGPRAVRVDELAAASGSAPSAIKPKPSKRKPSNIVRIDTVPPAPPAPNLASETDSNGSALPFPPSPLTPLSSPLASGSTSGTSPLVERPSRSEKVTIAQPAEGKERSRSRSHARPGDAWGDLRNAAARRAVQMQQKKRTIGNALAQAMTPQDVKMEVEVEYDFGGGSSTSAGATQNPSPLARPGMPPYGMCL